jgi:hypothetical protein
MARQACTTGFPDVSPADAWLLCRAPTTEDFTRLVCALGWMEMVA